MGDTSPPVKLPPFRSLGDFFPGVARFSLPHVQDPDRLANRIVRNLLYYQTNYFVLYGAVFLFICFLKPYRVIGGAIVLLAAIVVWMVLAAKSQRRHKHSPVMSLCILGGLLMLVYWLGFVAIFVASVAAPLGAIFLHASCRKRNLKNQLNWATERIGLRTTVMAAILEVMTVRLDMEV